MYWPGGGTMKNFRKLTLALSVVGLALATPQSAFAGLFGPPKLPAAAAVEAPAPIAGNAGKYMCPFTSDGVTAEWVTKAMKVQAGGQMGAMAGQIAGQELMKQIPFFGGMLGSAAGNAVGRSIALKGIGGEAFLKSSSDLSFNSPDELLVYVYAKYSTVKDYDKILAATYSIYPDLRDRYYPAVAHAKLMPAPPATALTQVAPSPTPVSAPAAAPATGSGGSVVASKLF